MPKGVLFGKVAGPQSVTLSKKKQTKKLYYKYFVNYVANFLFSVVAAGRINWTMIDRLQNKDESLNGQYLLSSAINKKEREIWKLQCRSSQWKV